MNKRVFIAAIAICLLLIGGWYALYAVGETRSVTFTRSGQERTMRTRTFDALRLENTGTTSIDAFQLIIDDSYVLGSVTLDTLLQFIVFRNEVPYDEVEQIWKFASDAFTHYCSLGSPVGSVHTTESLLQELVAYPFACCSDVNPLLEKLLSYSGYTVRRLWSPYHQALEVQEDGEWHYIDSDKDYYLKRDMLSEKIDQLALPEDERVYDLPFPEDPVNQGDLYQESVWNVTVEDPLVMDLDPGESITWSHSYSLPRIIATPAINLGKAEDGEVVAILEQLMELHSVQSPDVIVSADRCLDLSFESPLVINEASLRLPEALPSGASLAVAAYDEDAWLEVPEPIGTEIDLNHTLFSLGTQTWEIPVEDIVHHSNYGFRAQVPFQVIGNARAFDYALATDYALYEEGVLMTKETETYSDVFDVGGGYFRFDSDQGNNIYWSSTDGEDVRLKSYTFSAETFTHFWDPFGQYTIDIQLCGVDESFAQGVQVDIASQFNAALFPQRIGDIRVLTETKEPISLQVDVLP